LARAGRADPAAAARFLAHPFFERAPSKSLDRDDFSGFLPQARSPADGAATCRSACRPPPRGSPADARRPVLSGPAPAGHRLKPAVNHPFPLYR
jgi:hypothetical protein